ncbi:hypothetical protein P3L51_14800 [Streptomyces sp. PSRA5]
MRPDNGNPFAWLHGFKLLRARQERRADVQEAFRELVMPLGVQAG